MIPASTWNLRGPLKLLFTFLTLVPIIDHGWAGFRNNIRYTRISQEQGLSHATVYGIAQDGRGFMWFATQSGVNKYDGYRVFSYPHQPDNPRTPSGDSASTLMKTRDGLLWIGTWGYGIDVLDPETGLYQNHPPNPNTPGGLIQGNIQALYEDTEGYVWVGTSEKGLCRLDRASQRFQFMDMGKDGTQRIWSIMEDRNRDIWIGATSGVSVWRRKTGFWNHYSVSSALPGSPEEPEIRSVFQDRLGRIWLGSRAGLLYKTPDSDVFIRVEDAPGSKDQLTDETINTFYQDRDGQLYIATLRGLIVLRSLKVVDSERAYATSDYLLPDVEVRSIFVDKTGLMWVGSRHEGIYKIQAVQFQHIKKQPGKSDSLSGNLVNTIYQDGDGQIWVATRSGLNLWDRETGTFTIYRHNPNEPYSLSHDAVRAVLEDGKGRFWVGTYNGGLNLMDRETGRFRHYRSDRTNPRSLSDDSALCIYEDKNGALWIGTRNGLNLFDEDQEDFTRWTPEAANPNTLSHGDIRRILEDRQGRFWLGTKFGLNLFDRDTGRSRRFLNNPRDPNSLSNNEIWCLHEDWKGRIWAGTDLGLNLYLENDVFQHYNMKTGLPGNLIYGVLDDGQNLWISTGRGLSRFNPETGDVRNFDTSHGLQSSQFIQSAAYKSSAGEMFFGGINGFNSFYPESIKENLHKPSVVFSVFHHLGGVSQDFQDISTVNLLDLNYDEAVFSLEFAALDYTSPELNRYAWRWRDRDRQWRNLGSRRFVNFSNLAPGDYQFQVKGSNSDGLWNQEGAVMTIIVHPPWWRTPHAFAVYIILIGAVIYAAIRRQTKKLTRERHMTNRERMVSRRLRQVDKIKDEILANTSHELRTPLNGIIGLTESLLDGVAGPLNETLRSNLAMVVSNGKRLSNLVNDILDYSKLHKNHLELSLRPVNLHHLVSQLIPLVAPLVKSENLQLINRIPPHFPTVLGDENRLQQIFFNLIGNGVKFTEYGTVEVSATVQEQTAFIQVSDTGVGIAPEKQSRVFESFEQADGDTVRLYGGTGLGLAITRKLVEMHSGSIELDSVEGKGSVFTFTLPISGEPMETPTELSVARIQEQHSDQETISAAQKWDGEIHGHILVVDDEPVNRRVLINHLSALPYDLTEASSGPEALKLLENKSFDLILLDLMMPGMSGYQVCEKIRKTHTVHDLPILILTARDRVSDLARGFAAGANDYLAKPVAKNELLARIHIHFQLLDMHRNLEHKVEERTTELVEKNKEVIKAQEHIVIQEKMASLGTLTAGVAHEINNPINFAHGSVQNLISDLEAFREFLMEAAGEDAETVVIQALDEHLDRLTNHTETIKEGTIRVRGIVRDLHSFSRLDQAPTKHVSLAENLRSTLNLVRSKYQDFVNFQLNLQEDILLECRPAELNQVFMNLMVNGCQAILTQQKNTGSRTPLTLSVETLTQDEQAIIKIRDQGCGVPSSVRDRIFEPFFTTKSIGEGTGLGLSISYGIIGKHGGSIEVDSQDDCGATFTVRLPLNART